MFSYNLHSLPSVLYNVHDFICLHKFAVPSMQYLLANSALLTLQPPPVVLKHLHVRDIVEGGRAGDKFKVCGYKYFSLG